MSDWQPVKIAPPPTVEICAMSDEQRVNCRKNAGKIIRARPIGSSCTICGGRTLTIHPEDFRKLDLPKPPEGYLSFSRVICETQVETD